MIEMAEQMDLIGTGDTEGNEWRIFGPPGTGKTTHTGRQVRRAVEKYGPGSVMITSFSRAAAAELVSRDLPVDRDKIGTLHAHCYRALGRPVIAESKVSDWNEEFPHWAIGAVTENELDEPMDSQRGNGGNGDDLLAAANRWRNRMVPTSMWLGQAEAQRFYQHWCEWKQSNGFLDFTDLLEMASRERLIAPGDPRVIFADEAQDFTRLQLELIRRWGSHADYYVVVGDDDQTIYNFTGATPHAFLKPAVPAERKITLSQSFRVPQVVHSCAMQWISRVRDREEKVYRPTQEVGEIEYRVETFLKPYRLIDSAEKEIAKGRTVMFLAACSYMLNGIRNELVERGIPFHNPYRRKRRDWNPLFAANGTSAAERVLAFLRPHNSMDDAAQPWSAGDWRKWADWLYAAGTFQIGGKTGPKNMQDQEPITIEQLHEWLAPAAYTDLMNGIMNGSLREHLEWWIQRIQKSHANTAGFPCRIALTRGVDALSTRPKAILGTIHSVKGGESDVVYLCPDLSRAAANDWARPGEFYDSIVRQFYVGMTRARHKLVICESSGMDRVDL